MISEPFAIGNSIIHQLDPRIRVGFTILYAFAVALSYQFSVLITALVISSVLIVISQVRITEVFKRIIWVNALIFLLWLLLPFTFKGEILTRIGSFAIYRPGVVLAAQITLKSNAILLAFIALVATMPFSTLGHALFRFRPGTNANTYRTYSYVVGMLFVRAAARAERVHHAMLCRGFKGKFYSLQEFQIDSASWMFSILMTAVIGALVFWEILNG